MLILQRLSLFLWNIVYTGFYAKIAPDYGTIVHGVYL